jgi:2-polyprenyl-3-methyl-5-hydroxy-6-metoxy-1,4-benzoquinol methylase
MPILNAYACRKRIEFSCPYISKDAHILEIGCGGGWFADYMKSHGWDNYIGLDLAPPADIVGDIKYWTELGIREKSYDVIVGFEVIEHVNCFQELHSILKDDGVLILTSPDPHFDWICKVLEFLGLNQKRTSPHDHLVNFKDVPYFKPIRLKRIGWLIQWGVFKKH